MLPSGQPNPMGSGQPSLLRTSSSLLSAGGQPGMGMGGPGAGVPGGGGGVLPSQSPFGSLASPRTQYGGGAGNNGLLAGASNVASLLGRQSFGNGGHGAMPGGGLPMGALQQRGGGLDGVGDLVGSGGPDAMSSFPSSSQGSMGSQLGNDNLQQQQQQQMDVSQDSQQQQQHHHHQQHQQQLSMPYNQHHMLPQTQQQPQQGQQPAVKLENGGVLGSVKMEQQMGQPDQNGPAHAQMLRSSSGVKLEPQLQALRSLGAVKMEHQSSDPSVFLQQQQQQHQQQQQQILNMRTPGKPTPYEPGTCAKRLTHYMYHQQNRPQDNNIEYWRNFVNEYFAPSAKKRWCVSLYGNGRQTTGVFPQDVWHCEICNRKPGRGFETTVEVLPRLCQIKYASGTLEELLYVDMPRESQNTSGQIVLDYTKAIQESVFEQLRIASWEFCARRHEELIPRRSIIPQVSQLGAVVQKYQSSAQNSAALSSQDMQNNCNSFVACARQLAKALEVPLVNDLGYTKRYVRCLQIAEVVNCMKDLIDYSRQTGSGPIDSLHKFPRRGPSGISSVQPQQQQQPEEQQPVPQNSNQSGQNSAAPTGMQVSAAGNGEATSNNSLNCAPSTSAPSSSSVVGLLQGSMNCRQDPPTSSSNGLYNTGNSASVAKANSTNSMPSNAPTSFPSPAPSGSNGNMMPAPQQTGQLNSPTMSSSLPPMQTPTSRPQEPEPSDSQSSVQRILQEMMMQSHMNGAGPVGSDMKRVNAITPGLNGVNSLIGNPMTNNPGINGMGFGAMGGLGQSMRTAMGNNVAMGMNGRTGMNHSAHDLSQLSHQQQQRDIGNQLLGGLRAANSFNNLQYDWKSSQ
ncbi:hypothetical protein EJB05_02500, partial [Eragrostis curvula]